MAKVTVENLKKVQSNIRKFITKELRKKELREAVGTIVVESIREKTFAAPKKSTRKWRERYDGLNNTHPSYQRNRINITFTGELLTDLQKNVKAKTTSKTFSYIIKHSDKLHKKYNGVSGKIGSRSKYSDISDGIINKWKHDYLKFDDKTLGKVLSYINDAIISSFKSISK